jgi:hypothetical protein
MSEPLSSVYRFSDLVSSLSVCPVYLLHINILYSYITAMVQQRTKKLLDQRKQSKLQWSRDQSETNANNLNNARHKGSRKSWNKNRKCLKDKINDLAMNSTNKNLRAWPHAVQYIGNVNVNLQCIPISKEWWKTWKWKYNFQIHIYPYTKKVH